MAGLSKDLMLILEAVIDLIVRDIVLNEFWILLFGDLNIVFFWNACGIFMTPLLGRLTSPSLLESHHLILR